MPPSIESQSQNPNQHPSHNQNPCSACDDKHQLITALCTTVDLKSKEYDRTLAAHDTAIALQAADQAEWKATVREILKSVKRQEECLKTQAISQNKFKDEFNEKMDELTKRIDQLEDDRVKRKIEQEKGIGGFLQQSWDGFLGQIGPAIFWCIVFIILLVVANHIDLSQIPIQFK